MKETFLSFHYIFPLSRYKVGGFFISLGQIENFKVMEKIYVLFFTKSDFITDSLWTTEYDGGGYPILASRHLEFLQMRMREEVNNFVEERKELLRRVEKAECMTEGTYSYEDIEENVEEGYRADGMGWSISGELNYGWNDEPHFFIQEMEIV